MGVHDPMSPVPGACACDMITIPGESPQLNSDPIYTWSLKAHELSLDPDCLNIILKTEYLA
jgi:hypothetical protein